MPTYFPDKRQPDFKLTSRVINQSIELLRAAGADSHAIRMLDIWNAHRLVEAARIAETNEELRNLFTGLGDPREREPKDEGAWS